MMLALQKEAVDILCLYDARYEGLYGPLFNPITHRPWNTYYTVAAFGMLFRLGSEIESFSDTKGVYAVAATDGNKNAIMIANISGETQSVEIEGVDLSDARWSVIDDVRLLSWLPKMQNIENNSVVLIEF